MTRVVITGVSGSVGVRAAERFLAHPAVSSVVGIDVNPLPDRIQAAGALASLEMHQVPLGDARAAEVFAGAEIVVHLASRFGPSRDGTTLTHLDRDPTERMLDLTAGSGASQLVVMSSAMVYGAWANNPIPLTEQARLRPNPGFMFAVEKVELESAAREWQARHSGARVAILRPTTAMAEGASTWVARAMRASAGLGSDHEPPLQFLHLDDLADAVVIAATGGLAGAYNVAPDGWVEGGEVRQLLGRAPRVRLPSRLAAEVADRSWQNRLAPTPPGIVPYLMHPWVIANDALRAQGWEPQFSTDETYVEGSNPRPWAMASSRQRQQMAIAGSVVAAVATAAVARSIMRRGR